LVSAVFLRLRSGQGPPQQQGFNSIVVLNKKRLRRNML
jgi:hypothetical protein